jgi:thiol-disulfide isomerase/thioredoxin
VVLLDFWGTWCPSCKPSAQEVQKIAEKYKSDPVKVYGLAVREPADEVPAAYMRDNHLSYGLLLQADQTAKTYRVRAFPAFFVIGKEGDMFYTTAGYTDQTPGKLIEAIDAALAGRPLPPPPPPPAPKPEAKGADKPAEAPAGPAGTPQPSPKKPPPDAAGNAGPEKPAKPTKPPAPGNGARGAAK